MRQTYVFVAVGLALVSLSLSFTNGQFQVRNTVPNTISACYTNITAFNRFTRQPMHINNLIAIIRKIEKKTDGQWDARRIARTLVNRYMFEGMEFNRNAKPEFQYGQKSEELAKESIIKDLIPIPVEEIFPDYILDNDEKCALHWMLSHSLNATMRDDESTTQTPSYGYNNNNNNNNNPTYSSGSGGNNPFNNNNGFLNPTNGNNGNSQMGNNWQYRGKREISESAENEEFSKNWNLSNETSPQEKVNAEYDQNSSEEDKDDYDAQTVNDTLSSNTSGNKESDESVPLENTDVEHVPNSSGNTSKSARQIAVQQTDYRLRTRRPLETGVVYTKWGSVAAGRLIAGIAAGLEPVTMTINGNRINYSPESSYGGGNGYGGSGSSSGNSWGSGGWKSSNSGGQFQYSGQQQPNNQQPSISVSTVQNDQNNYGQYNHGRKKRQVIQVQNLQPIESLYAVTLAGDAGQAAIKNAPYEMGNAEVPSGQFNDSVCPREFVLREHTDPSKDIYKDAHAWTYMTEAEIRGGLDGVIIGSQIRQWDPSYTLRLSDILSQYYSENGISGQPQYRSCDRSSLLSQSVDGNKLKEQTRSFAYLYNNRSSSYSEEVISTSDLFERIVSESYERMYRTATYLTSIDPPCTRASSANAGSGINDDQKLVIPRLNVYSVLDYTANNLEFEQQKRFLGNLAYELNVSPEGSRLGVVDGSSGDILISPNWTDVSSALACRIISLSDRRNNQDYSKAMTGIRRDLERVRSEELRYNYTSQNGMIILLLVQGNRMDENQRNEVIRIRDEINRDVYGDVTVVATSSKYSEGDFNGLTFIKLQQGANFSDLADEFAQSLIKNTHGALRYTYCNSFQYSQENEHKEATHLFITPGTIEYFKISPEYFFSARSLILRFTSDNGKVKVCMSRKVRYPTTTNEESAKVTCKETSGNYVVPGTNVVDVEFRDDELHKPCSKNKLEGCEPIFISITPTSYIDPGQLGLDCSVEGCQSSNQVKVTFTHWDMRCNGAMRTLFSSTVALITAAIALLNWIKT